MPRRATATSFGNSRGNKRGPGNQNGATPATLRLKMRNALARQIDVLDRIGCGELTIKETVVTQRGDEVEVERVPNFADRTRAADTLAKFGLGTKTELTGEDGQPIRVNQVWTFGSHTIAF